MLALVFWLVVKELNVGRFMFRVLKCFACPYNGSWTDSSSHVIKALLLLAKYGATLFMKQSAVQIYILFSC